MIVSYLHRTYSPEAYSEQLFSAEAEEALSNHLQRVISVKIVSGSHGHIVAILKVVVTPRPYVVHRVLR